MSVKHILIIDDNEDNRILVKFALETNPDWQVLTAKDGIEGIAKAKTERPDVILLDFIMPKLDGLAVYEVLKSNLFTCSIPIVFMTAMANNKLHARLENTLTEGVITKPFDLSQLNSLIADVCGYTLADYKGISAIMSKNRELSQA
jgi:CheY-like chemotaxis protein